MKLQTPRILWAALLGATAFYAVLGFTLAPHDLVPNQNLFFILCAAAMATTVMSFLIPSRLLHTALLDKEFAVEEVPDPADEAMFRDMPKMLRRFVDSDDVRTRSLASWQTPFIFSLAMSETVPIYGLVLAIVGYPPAQWLPFVGIGVVLIAIRFPSDARISRQIEAVYDARF